MIGLDLDLAFQFIQAQGAGHLDDLGDCRIAAYGNGNLFRIGAGSLHGPANRFTDSFSINDRLLVDRIGRSRFRRVALSSERFARLRKLHDLDRRRRDVETDQRLGTRAEYHAFFPFASAACETNIATCLRLAFNYISANSESTVKPVAKIPHCPTGLNPARNQAGQQIGEFRRVADTGTEEPIGGPRQCARTFGSPAILESSLPGDEFPAPSRRHYPLDRWLCAPAFQQVCPKTAANMHNRSFLGKGMSPLFQ